MRCVLCFFFSASSRCCVFTSHHFMFLDCIFLFLFFVRFVVCCVICITFLILKKIMFHFHYFIFLSFCCVFFLLLFHFWMWSVLSQCLLLFFFVRTYNVQRRYIMRVILEFDPPEVFLCVAI